MIDIILFGILGICAFIVVTFFITSFDWCQKLMLKKYFPQTVNLLKHYQTVYEMWQKTIQRLDKIDEDIKWHTVRIEYYFVTNQRDKFAELNEIYLERKRLFEHEKKLKELLKQDKQLIEAYAPFILFSEFHPFKILDRQEFNIFDVMWVHRKQKKFEKIVKKHLTYLNDCDII